jgi:hypothetical protein
LNGKCRLINDTNYTIAKERRKLWKTAKHPVSVNIRAVNVQILHPVTIAVIIARTPKAGWRVIANAVIPNAVSKGGADYVQ